MNIVQILLAFLHVSTGYIFMNGVIKRSLPIYLSSKLGPGHITCVLDAIDIYNIHAPEYYEPVGTVPSYISGGCIRIGYYDNDDVYVRITGSSKYTGTLLGDNTWLITNINIDINRSVPAPSNICTYIVLHELCHANGLFHSDVADAFMSRPVLIRDGFILNIPSIPYLEFDDIVGLSQYRDSIRYPY